MKSKFLGTVAIATVLLTMVGCTTFKAGGLAYEPTYSDVEILGSFKKSVVVSKFLGTSGGETLFNISQGSIDGKIRTVIQDEVAKLGGTGARNITIEEKASFLGMLGNSITGHIWAPTRIIVEGTVVRRNSSNNSSK